MIYIVYSSQVCVSIPFRIYSISIYLLMATTVAIIISSPSLLLSSLATNINVFAQEINPQHQQSESQKETPFTNEELPAQSQYNKYATEQLANLNAPLNKTLPKSNSTDIGIGPWHNNDWITVNHDIYYSRNSPQTAIGKDNVNNLQVKWILINANPIEQSPIIVGDRGYVQDNKARVIAFDVKTGLDIWKVETGKGATLHGITYDHGILFAPTGEDSTIVAINATDGKIIWRSPPLAPDNIQYEIVSPPIVWKNYVIAGSSGGDQPTANGQVQGNVTALDRTNGHVLWNFRTIVGSWVTGPGKSPPNGGATTWSGGSFDPTTGILYIPTGNATPDFNATADQNPIYM